MVLLLVAFAAGGGGSRQGLANLLVQLTALAVLVPHRRSFVQFLREAPLIVRVAICAAMLVPLLQIIPLPASLWQSLPGRELATRSLELADERGWMPISLYPLRTLLAFTALITPVAVLVAGWNVSRQRLATLGWMVVACGLATVLFGLVQLGATDDSGSLFGARNPGSALLGTFANRNSTALLLGFALGLAALLPSPRPHPAVLALRGAVCALLLLAIFLTKSRTGLALAGLPLALAAIKALWWALHARGAAGPGAPSLRPLALALGAMAMVATTGIALLVAAPGPIGEALERFEAKDDPRRYIWDDAGYSAERYWPVGAGIGTFDEVFQVDESLENLTKRTAGRAHNDYLELAIEAGIYGLALAMAWVVLIGWLSWQARHSSQRWVAWAGSAFLLAIVLQSITDYPLRNQTILAFGGFALLLLARIAAPHRRTQP